jgi:hypothetical protein
VSRVCALIVVVVAALFGGLRAAYSKDVPGDFLRYHRAGRLVATGRADLVYDEKFLAEQSVYADLRAPDGKDYREMEFKYAPALAVMMAPLGALPPRAANVVWDAWNAALIAAIFVAAWTWCGAGISAWWILVPFAVLFRVATSNVNLGQLNPTSIVPASIGLWLVSRGRDRTGGALVGFGAVVKFMPGVLALWLAWKRRWAAAAACLGAVVVLGVALPTVVFGPSRCVALHEEWLGQRAHTFTDAASRDLPGHSVKSFVYRVLGDTPFVSSAGGPSVRIVVGHGTLSPEVLRILVLALDALLLAAVAWFTFGPLRGGDDPRGPPEASLALASLSLVSPEARPPHFLSLTLPLVALTAALVRGPRRAGAAALAVVGAVLLNATIIGRVDEEIGRDAEIYCALGWAALCFGAALVLVLRGGAPSNRESGGAPRATGP